MLCSSNRKARPLSTVEPYSRSVRARPITPIIRNFNASQVATDFCRKFAVLQLNHGISKELGLLLPQIIPHSFQSILII